MNFILEPAQLTIKMEGFEKFWALKSRLQIPQYAIENITYDLGKPQVSALHRPFFRFPGSALPGILFAGTYMKRGERDFWYLNMQQEGVLSMTFRPGTLNYDRAILSCASPEMAAQIIAWWKAGVH